MRTDCRNKPARRDHFDYAARMYPISSPELNEFYGKLAIVTQTRNLWSIERLRTIVLFNLGAYDRLVAGRIDLSGACPGVPTIGKLWSLLIWTTTAIVEEKLPAVEPLGAARMDSRASAVPASSV